MNADRMAAEAAEIARPHLIGAMNGGYRISAQMARNMAAKMREGSIPTLPGAEVLEVLATVLEHTAAVTPAT